MVIPTAGVREWRVLQACNLEGMVGEIPMPDLTGSRVVQACRLQESFVDSTENIVSIRDPRQSHLWGLALLGWPAQRGRFALECRDEKN